jgi:mRNA-degrading endonuclease toxin of MazEF toxin-antitoxin module
MTRPLRPIQRGQVYDLNIHGPHYFLVVSNDSRNDRLPTFVGVRITSTLKRRGIPTVVELSDLDGMTARGIDGNPLAGFILCDTILQLPPENSGLAPHLRGHLSPQTMQAVDAALRIALDL